MPVPAAVGGGAEGVNAEDLWSAAGVRRALEERGMAPLRRWGQHFLVDRRVAGRIADAVAQAAERWGLQVCLEVGPGLGALTSLLVQRGLQVVGVEVDRGLCALLRERFSEPDLRVVEGDILRVPEPELPPPARTVWCGNLPYYLSGPLLRQVLARPHPAYVAMVQREVGQRLLAPPGDPNRGALTVLAQAVAAVERLERVPAAAFYPRPEVESVVVRLWRREAAPWDPFTPASLATLRATFGHRRKSVRQSLQLAFGGRSGVVESILERAGVAAAARPQDLAEEEWAALSRAVEPHLAELKAAGRGGEDDGAWDGSGEEAGGRRARRGRGPGQPPRGRLHQP